MTDRELLEQYRASKSQAAFAELARRHMDWVYSIARRRTRDSHLAEDVTQAVFLVLAQQAEGLPKSRVLESWLFGVTQNACAMAIRGEARRKRHEKQAALMTMAGTESVDEEAWEQIAPTLDELLGKLREQDRTAVLLRFYQRKNFAEVGAALDISEEAAKKRVGRALEKLRMTVAGKGTVLSAGVLGAGLLTYATQPAPASLATAITTGTFSMASSAALIAKGAVQMMAWAKVQLVALGLAILLTGTGGIVAVGFVMAQSTAKQAATQPATQPAATQSETAAYAPGDLVRVSVKNLFAPRGRTDIDVHIDSNGNISLPVAIEVHLAGLSQREARVAVNLAYRNAREIESAAAQVTKLKAAGPGSITAGPIGVEDVLRIRYWDLEAFGKESVKELTVGDDGTISMPLVKPIKVAGLSEGEAVKKIQKTYFDAGIIQNLAVTVLRIASADTKL